jgi:hypothetical protein
VNDLWKWGILQRKMRKCEADVRRHSGAFSRRGGGGVVLSMCGIGGSCCGQGAAPLDGPVYEDGVFCGVRFSVCAFIPLARRGV